MQVPCLKQPKRFVFSRRAPEILDELPASAVLEETIIEQRVTGADWRMTGLSEGDVEGRDVLIRDGDQRYCQIRSSRFKGAEFDGCNLRNAEMGKAKLFNADLRGSGGSIAGNEFCVVTGDSN